MSRSEKRDQAVSNNPLAKASGEVYRDDSNGTVTTSESFKQFMANRGNNKAIVSTLSSNDIRTGVFKWTPIGLEVDGNISREDWEETGRMLSFMDSALQWLIGDWLIAGEVLKYGDREEFAEAIGFKKETLYQYAWVANKVEISIRIENLKFGHHVLVAGMEPEDQKKWLGFAEENGLSVAKLREAIKTKSGYEAKKKRLDSVLDHIGKFKKGFQKLRGYDRVVVIENLEKLLDELRGDVDEEYQEWFEEPEK